MAKDTKNYTPHGGEHLMAANNTGYEKLGDTIWPCPGTAQIIDEILVRDAGLQAYIDAMNQYIVEQFRVLAEDKRRWWDGVWVAYGMDRSANYQWNPRDKCIEKVPTDAVSPKKD